MAASVDPSILNVERMWREFDDDRELLVEMAGRFHGERDQLLADLKKALAAGDAANVAFWAHKLAGTVAVFSAVAARDAAHRVEDLARSGNLPSAPPAVAALEQELNRLGATLDQLAAGH